MSLLVPLSAWITVKSGLAAAGDAAATTATRPARSPMGPMLPTAHASAPVFFAGEMEPVSSWRPFTEASSRARFLATPDLQPMLGGLPATMVNDEVMQVAAGGRQVAAGSLQGRCWWEAAVQAVVQVWRSLLLGVQGVDRKGKRYRVAGVSSAKRGCVVLGAFAGGHAGGDFGLFKAALDLDCLGCVLLVVLGAASGRGAMHVFPQSCAGGPRPFKARLLKHARAPLPANAGSPTHCVCLCAGDVLILGSHGVFDTVWLHGGPSTNLRRELYTLAAAGPDKTDPQLVAGQLIGLASNMVTGGWHGISSGPHAGHARAPHRPHMLLAAIQPALCSAGCRSAHPSWTRPAGNVPLADSCLDKLVKEPQSPSVPWRCAHRPCKTPCAAGAFLAGGLEDLRWTGGPPSLD